MNVERTDTTNEELMVIINELKGLTKRLEKLVDKEVISELPLSDSTVDTGQKKKLLMDIFDYSTKDTVYDVIWGDVNRFTPIKSNSGITKRKLINCISSFCNLDCNMSIILFTNDFEFNTIDGLGKKTLEVLNIICDDYITQFNISRKEILNCVNGEVYENIPAFINDYIDTKKISLEQEGKNLLEQINDIAKVVNMNQFYNGRTSHSYIYPYSIKEMNSKTIYDFISRSLLYFEVQGSKYYDIFIEKILPKCNRFFAHFGINHKDYLEMALIICTDNNREEFMKHHKKLRDSINYYINKNFNFGSFSSQTSDSLLNSYANDIAYDTRFKFSESDPNTVYDLAKDCIKEQLPK